MPKPRAVQAWSRQRLLAEAVQKDDERARRTADGTEQPELLGADAERALLPDRRRGGPLRLLLAPAATGREREQRESGDCDDDPVHARQMQPEIALRAH